MVDAFSMLDWFFLAFFAIGSTPIGYFVLRMAYPEIRVFDPAVKVGYSMIAGIGLVLCGLLLEFIIFALQPFWTGGLLPITVLFAIVSAFVLLRVFAMLKLPNSIELGLPIRHNPTNPTRPVYIDSEQSQGAVGALGNQMLLLMQAMKGQSKEQEINIEDK